MPIESGPRIFPLSWCVKNPKTLSDTNPNFPLLTSELTEDDERDALALPGAGHVAGDATVVALVTAAESDDAQVSAGVDSNPLGRRLTNDKRHSQNLL